MRKFMGKSLCSVLLCLIMLSGFNIETFAASDEENNLSKVVQLDNGVVQLDCEVSGYVEMPEIVPYATTFVNASITISYDSQGMYVDICTGMNDVASVVGVKDIEIQKKVLFGWETVAVSSGGESYNVTTSVCTIFYDNAVEGQTYRVRCIHYGNVDGYREMEAESGGFKYVI